jgi:hypothetical protein
MQVIPELGAVASLAIRAFLDTYRSVSDGNAFSTCLEFSLLLLRFPASARALQITEIRALAPGQEFHVASN